MTPAPATLIGLDYGRRRIGIAVSDPSGTLASAVGTHRTDRDGPFFPCLDRLILERGATGIVVGLPLTEAGEEGEMACCARDFAAKVAGHTGLPVTLCDERLSSREATGLLRLGGRRRLPKEAVDAVAAELILQQHLDRLARRSARRGPEST